MYARAEPKFTKKQASNGKLCAECGIKKPLTHFYFGTGRKRDCYSSCCRACLSVRKNEAYRKNNPVIKCRRSPKDDKRCPGCNKFKPVGAFSKGGKRNGGIDAYCILCKRINNRKNADPIGQHLRYKARLKKLRDSNDREYKLREMLRRAKHSAKKNDLPFNLTLDYLKEIVVDACPVFGTRFNWFADSITRSNAPSLDKFDPSKGYVVGNVYFISWKANAMKQNATPDEVMALASWMQSISKGVVVEKSDPSYISELWNSSRVVSKADRLVKR